MWDERIRAAIRFWEDVQSCLKSAGVTFDMNWTPWQSGASRSLGVTACFSRDEAYSYLSVYEYWSSDEICLKFEWHPPMKWSDDHDIPHLTFDCSKRNLAILVVQLFLQDLHDFHIEKDDLCVPCDGYMGVCTANRHIISKATPLAKKALEFYEESK